MLLLVNPGVDEVGQVRRADIMAECSGAKIVLYFEMFTHPRKGCVRRLSRVSKNMPSSIRAAPAVEIYPRTRVILILGKKRNVPKR